MTATRLGTPVQGVTLYSFTRFFHDRRLDFEDLVREVARRGLGPGLEIVGFQSIRDFPRVSEEFVTRFRELIDETGLVPTSLATNADAGLRRDRNLTNDELVDYMAEQIVAARRLGFSIARVQNSLTPDDMERLLPIAEREGVALGMEIHSHHSVHHPLFERQLERVVKLGSPLLGFVPDWGATMVGVPPSLYRKYRQRGLSEELLTEIDALWHEMHREGAPMDEETQGARFGRIIQLAHRHGAGDYAIELAVNTAGLFGHAPVAEWADILAWAVHTHGKFYEIDEHGNEPAVPIPDIVDVYVKGGYSRGISSEWEGFHWNDWDDAFDVIAGQQALMRRSAEASGSRMVTDADEARTLIPGAAAVSAASRS